MKVRVKDKGGSVNLHLRIDFVALIQGKGSRVANGSRKSISVTLSLLP
jgi:hypothetical protein